jgi:protein TonB
VAARISHRISTGKRVTRIDAAPGGGVRLVFAEGLPGMVAATRSAPHRLGRRTSPSCHLPRRTTPCRRGRAMAAALPLRSGYRGRQTPVRRALSTLLAVAVVALILLALIRLGAFVPDPDRPQPRLSTFDVLPAPTIAGQRTPVHAHAKEAARGAKPPPPRVVETPPRPPVPPPALVNPNSPPMIVLSREEFAASDISKIHGSPGTGTAGSKGEAGSGAGDSSAVAGNGPNGEKMFVAEWYRHPTHAETSTYMPHNAPEGAWGDVACRTAPRYHVEDCRELDESPIGSGMSRAVRNAAWQFLVRPPRVGGRELIGSWVRIRITISGSGGD